MYFKHFIVFGITHKNLDLCQRENFIQNDPTSVVERLFKEKKVVGYVNLSTCLRVEYYLHLDKNYSVADFQKEIGLENIFIKQGHDAVNYLFRVTCGFESVIKGEDQILAQIKKAQLTSMENKISSSNINVIFNKAIELGKKFRNKSKICHNALSLEAISLKFIKNKVSQLKDKKILILGVGDLARDIMELITKEEYKSLTITNRSYHKALEVSNIYNADVISFENKLEEVANSDVIISATSAPHAIIKKNEIISLLDNEKEYVFLDLAVPRDIEEELNELDNINLYNIDDVWGVYYENLENRENLLTKYEYMLGEQMINLKKWFEYKEGIA
ncbi:glutamyl-tRNA reductase [Cetobacterium somerae]|uniref:glutamyl-tRNA reductase n=1 Tax=Cetobacterium sp. NK01 TaxID=2993530 RepID=UPI0021165438|nr:glutamyl-tRNA reductase [Cetobacterium sp. NK01]MCQ8212343.1 glutamyl-tRNA reductase [Cetobacterium sp. NK01]